MGLSGNERKRPGWLEALSIRIRISGGLLNYVLVKFGLGNPTNISISREHEKVPSYRCPCCRSLTLHRRGLPCLSQSTSEALYIPERANQTNRCKV